MRKLEILLIEILRAGIGIFMSFTKIMSADYGLL